MAPSTPAYGNYQNYYAKRGTSVLLGDRRVACLPEAWVTGRRVLDIGANSGLPSVALGLAGAAVVTGVDIDPDLVRKAQTHLAFVESLRKPTTGSADYFPVALPKEHGFVPPAAAGEAAAGENQTFPANVRFVAADWVMDEIDADVDGYDLVLALSLTKWVHLHHGDDGIRSFFAKIYRVLAPGGRLVLEPQSWATYKDAVKKTQGAVPKTRLAELELRPTDFGQVLGALGFERETLLREAGAVADQKSTDANQAGFDRSIEVYLKRAA